MKTIKENNTENDKKGGELPQILEKKQLSISKQISE